MSCDDGDLCTDDTCDSIAGCSHAANPCSCGDVNVDAAIDLTDVDLFRAHLSNPSGVTLPPGATDRCNVVGAPRPCDLLDLVVLRRALTLPARAPGIAPVCPAA